MGNFDVTYNVLQVHLTCAVALWALQTREQKEPPILPSNNYLTLALQPLNYPWTKEVIFCGDEFRGMGSGGWPMYKTGRAKKYGVVVISCHTSWPCSHYPPPTKDSPKGGTFLVQLAYDQASHLGFFSSR